MSYTHPFFKFSLIFRKAKVLSKREAPMNTFERYILKIDTKLEKKKKSHPWKCGNNSYFTWTKGGIQTEAPQIPERKPAKQVRECENVCS